MHLDHLVNSLEIYEFNALLHQRDAPSMLWEWISQPLNKKKS